METKRVRVTPQAERDIDNEVIYLATEADAATGIRFFDAVQETFRALLDTVSAVHGEDSIGVVQGLPRTDA